MFSVIFRRVGNVLSEMRRRRVVRKAIDLFSEKRYPEAARLYAEYAGTLLPGYPLHFCLYSFE